jgi:hypothetical protein
MQPISLSRASSLTAKPYRADWPSWKRMPKESVVCGYSQVYGIDYSETYSPTTPISTIFMLMHIGASLNLFTAIFDVTAAFLEGTNDFKQYCWLPKELGLDGIHKLRV